MTWFSGAGYVGGVLLLALLGLLLARWRAELVALLVLIALEIPGVLTREEALAGFSNSAVITILGLFVVGAALERTGVADGLAGWIVRLSGASEARLILVLMLGTAALSLVMNNVAAGAVMLPAAVRAARRLRVAPGRVLMPMAFAAGLGGMATIFTTANILVSNLLRTQQLPALSFLDFFPIGSLLVGAGIAYMLLVGRHWLPRGDPLAQASARLALVEAYGLNERLWEVQITADSPLDGQTLGEANIGERWGVAVVARLRGQSSELAPGPTTGLAAGDVLLITGREERVRALPGVVLGRQRRSYRYLVAPEVQLAEVIVAPRATILGQTLKQLEFRRRYGVTVVAIWRNDRIYRTDVGSLPLRAGDALLIVGDAERLQQLTQNPAFVFVTPPEGAPRQPHRERRAHALAITLLVLALSVSHWLPTSIAVLLGVVLFVISGCLSMDEALAAIDWRTILIIAGMLPLSVAMQKTGLADQLGQLAAVAGHVAGEWGLIAGLYLTTVLLAQVLGGQVTPLVMGPIAIAAAPGGLASPRNLAIVVALACSTSFLTPFSHPVNLLVVSPGGYTARDFVRVGAGLTLVCLLTVLAGVWLLPGG